MITATNQNAVLCFDQNQNIVGRLLNLCEHWFTIMDIRKMLLLLLLLECEFLNCLYVYLNDRKRVLRRWWVRPINQRRDELGFHSNLISELLLSDHEEFFSYCRMWPEHFNTLLRMVRPFLLKRSRRQSLPIKLKLAATLAYLAHGDSVKSKAWEFRIGKSTMYKIIPEVCQAIWTALQPLHLPKPSYESWTQVAEDSFLKWQFPNCVGAIDGRHMQIQAPANSGSEFFNYKKHFSIVLMASCDASYKFTWVDIGQYGSISDGGVWNNSILADALEHEGAKLPPPKILPGSRIKFPHVLVADEAFPLKSYLMRPYPRAALQDKQRVFNYRLSRARRVIENAFGILVSRWRILRRCICNNPQNAEVIFQALVILHNFIMTEESKETYQCRNYCPPAYVDHEDEDGNTIPGGWRTEEDERGMQKIGRTGANNPARTAAQLRDTLCDYFISEAGEVAAPWQYQRAFRGSIINLP